MSRCVPPAAASPAEGSFSYPPKDFVKRYSCALYTLERFVLLSKGKGEKARLAASKRSSSLSGFLPPALASLERCAPLRS